jgi:hypothetical protein
MASVAGHDDYRGFVGPTKEYDLMGAMQFSLLCAFGLRENHRLLDIGCGSLRGGRLFIAYLAPGGYTGIEPNRWLVDEGVEKQLGHDLVALKMPTFLYNDRFDASGLERFPFVVAQSIASHTGPAMTRALLAGVGEALAPSGVAAITFIHGRPDSTEEGWKHPGAVRYRRRTIKRWLAEAGLSGVPLRWYHPRQTWWVIVHHGTPLPPVRLRLQAQGAMSSFERSWKMRMAYRAAIRLYRSAPIRLRRSKIGRRLAARLGIGRFGIE